MCDECGKPFKGAQLTCASCIAIPFNARARDRRYSLEPGQYQRMLDEQHGLCAICGRPEKSVSSRTGKLYPLAVDHDRSCCPGDTSCGRCVRQLICRNCNVLIGMADDDISILIGAADYIRRFARTQASQVSP